MLTAALERLSEIMTIERRSAIYETAPKYVTDQPAFLNMAVAGRTDVEPHPLLAALKAIERDLGREAGRRYGPRPIDLDILFYGSARIDTEALRIPHPRLGERGFVLRPLADIAPDLRHPETGASVVEMLAALPPGDGVRPYEE
jgi:2-amino-4-hydroxy-6-hydroxymethyldihydropteridine diphosphokinase